MRISWTLARWCEFFVLRTKRISLSLWCITCNGKFFSLFKNIYIIIVHLVTVSAKKMTESGAGRIAKTESLVRP